MEKIKKLLQYKYTPYIVYMMILAIWHTQYECTADDLGVIQNLKPTLSEEIANLSATYEGWSSRVLINPLIFLVAHFDIAVWQVLDVAFLTITAILFTKLVWGEISNKRALITVLVMFVYPFQIIFDVGWLVTSMTYVWPTMFGALACMSIRKDVDGIDVKFPEALLYCIALIYATNIEGLSVMLCLVFFFYAFLRKRDKGVHWLILVQALISGISVIWHMVSPGNQSRIGGRITGGLLDRMETGFSSTLASLFFTPNYLCICFLILLVVCMQMTENKSNRFGFVLVGIVSVTQMLIGKIIPIMCGANLFSNVVYEFFADLGPISEGKYMRLESWLYLLVSLIILVLIVWCSFAYFEKRRALLIVVVLIAGFVARMTVGYAYGHWYDVPRTHYSVNISMMIAMLLVYKQWEELNIQDGQDRKVLRYLFAIAAFGGLKSFYYVFVGI